VVVVLDALDLLLLLCNIEKNFIVLLNLESKQGAAMSSNWLGTETPEDQAFAYQQLQIAYSTNYLSDDSDRVFGSPDHNHQVVAEALRLKLLPAEFLDYEFYGDPNSYEQEFEEMEVGFFDEEVTKIREMSASEREMFVQQLTGRIGSAFRPSDDHVVGFAIDKETHESLLAYDFGSHRFALDRLLRMIGQKERGYKYLTDLVYKQNLYLRLFEGYILSAVEGFENPILLLYRNHSGEEEFARVMRYLMNERKYIPVDIRGCLVEE